MKPLDEIRATLEGLRGSSLRAKCCPLGAALVLAEATGDDGEHPSAESASVVLGWPTALCRRIIWGHDRRSMRGPAAGLAAQSFAAGIDEGIAWIDRREQAEA